MTHNLSLGPSRRQSLPSPYSPGTLASAHIEHPHSECDVTPTWLGVRNRGVLMEDTSDAQLAPVRLYLHPGDAEDEEYNSFGRGFLLS